MNNTPINKEIVDSKLQLCEITNLAETSIRDVVRVVNMIEEESGEKFVRMEMGIPSLKPAQVGVDAEKAALDNGVAATYPMLEGVKELKNEGSRFIKSFMDIDLKPEGVIPTVGSMQGGFAAFMTIAACDKNKDTILFIDPGFPVQKTQLDVLGQKYLSFDVYDYRGEKLRTKLESILQQGNIAGIIYSNPNNPAWICLNDDELRIIGELSKKYDVTIIEDLAYFAMDFRSNLGVPNVAPFQPTVAKYTDNYVLMISSSKVFSYAGQRIGLLCVSDGLFHRKFANLKQRFGGEEFGYTIVYRIIYTLSSGVSHSAQYALSAMLKAANDGEFDFVSYVKEYGERAEIMKKLFTDNGFNIVYDKDMEEPLANGFYFTIGFPGMTGAELAKTLFYYGISAICLNETGSQKEGLRACVAQVRRNQFEDLEKRLKAFSRDYNK